MGFFNKIFGASKEESSIRAQYKNEKYFKSEAARCEKWINNDSEDFAKYIEQHGELSPFHYISACTIRLDKFSNLYSQGESVEKIKPIFREVIELFPKGWSEDFQSYNLLLQMTSLGILLDVSTDDFNKITDFIEKASESNIEELWKPDSLIFFLIGKKNKDRKGDKPSDMLYKITQLPQESAQKELGVYLDKWYALHKEEAWYDSHLREWGYSGYWAWEVAAVVKVMNLDDNSFKDHPYYPYDLVHWKD